MARIHIDDDKLIGPDAEIGLWCPLPPKLDLPSLYRGIEQPVRRQLAVGMLGGVVAARPAAQIAAAGADHPAVVCDGPVDWQHGVTVASEGERGGERRLGHRGPPRRA